MTCFDILNIEYMDDIMGEETYDYPDTMRICVKEEDNWSHTEDAIRKQINNMEELYANGVRVVDFTAFYEGTDKPLRGNYEDFSADTYIDLSPFKQRIANGASAKNVIETYRIHGNDDRKELMDYERRLYETETFEDCEVCYATVDKGTLNDVQAGRICNECHKMNQYEGGTKTPYNAESLREEYERHWGKIDDDQAKGLIRCVGCDEPASYYDEVNFCEACQERKKEGLMDDEGNFTDDPSHPLYEYPKPKYAETDLGFKEWADQEMKTHGKKESFDDWLDDELESHGDNVSLQDWGHHELDSHYERYEAEDWGGDPKGQLATALRNARIKAKQPKKPLKIEKLGAENEDGERRFFEFKEDGEIEYLVFGKGRAANRKTHIMTFSKHNGNEPFSMYDKNMGTPKGGTVCGVTNRAGIHTFQWDETLTPDVVNCIRCSKYVQSLRDKNWLFTEEKKAETSGQWEIGEQLEEAQMNAEDQNTDLLKWIEDYLWDNDKKGYQAYHAHRKSLGLNAEGKKRKKISGVLSDPFDELSLDSGGIKKGIVALAAVGLTIFGINKLRK